MLYQKENTIEYMAEENISFSQRMISACSGSLVTSLVVTPFDVIRIRIQQQSILPQEQPCCQLHFPEHTSQKQKVPVEMAPELFWIHDKYCQSAESCTRIYSTFQGSVQWRNMKELELYGEVYL